MGRWVEAGIGLAAFLIMYRIAYGKPKKKEKKTRECTTNILSGKLVGIVKDEETGLSCIYVDDGKGNIIYGFSSSSVQELEHVYKKDDYVQVPVVLGTK